MKSKVLALLALLALLLGMVACGEKALPTTAVTIQSHWPTKAWRTSTPEEQGMDSDMLADMLETIHEQNYDIDSVVVIRNGYMVADAAMYPFEPGSRHIVYSCTKSVVSALVGIAIDKGYIKGVDQPILGFFPKRIEGRQIGRFIANDVPGVLLGFIQLGQGQMDGADAMTEDPHLVIEMGSPFGRQQGADGKQPVVGQVNQGVVSQTDAVVPMVIPQPAE